MDTPNANALGTTTIVNEGLIQGDGSGPEGVAPTDAARFDLRGNEAINLVGDYKDFVGNNSTGHIVGGIAMGGARDTPNNSGSIVAMGGSAIDMGADNDQVNLYVGSTVSGAILLGDGDDVANSTSASASVIDGGAGNDSIAMSYTIFGGDDVLFGGAGNDSIYGGLGEDRIYGGLNDDTLFGEVGDAAIAGGLGDDAVKGNAGGDRFIVTRTDDGHDGYDGGAGSDTLDYSALTTAVSLTLKPNAATTFAAHRIENIENLSGGSAADRLIGDGLDNRLTSNASDDKLRGGGGNDILDGGAGRDALDGGVGDDRLTGGLDADELKGAPATMRLLAVRATTS